MYTHHITSQIKGIWAGILDNSIISLKKQIMYIQTLSVLKIQKIKEETECDHCNQFNYLRVLNIAEMNIQSGVLAKYLRNKQIPEQFNHLS